MVLEKNIVTGFGFVKYQPMRQIEDICVFYSKSPTYNPQGLKPIPNPKLINKHYQGQRVYKKSFNDCYIPKYTGYPTNLLEFKKDGSTHPTQKPVALCEYLIRTYTNEGDTVLDNCMGSGTTGVACVNTNRNFIGIELDKEYFNIAKNRIKGSE